LFFPETKGKSLEEMDNLFDRKRSDREHGTPVETGTESPAASIGVEVEKKA
jgi:hypothetical protein